MGIFEIFAQFIPTILLTVTILIPLFAIVAIVLFIRDGILAKREGRDRKRLYKVMFILGMTLIALLVVIFILLCILAVLIMRSM